jgi:hypothetical protein
MAPKIQGTPNIKPEPQRTIITDALQTELPKLNPEIESKVADVVRRKP